MIKYVNGTVFNQNTCAKVNTVNTVGVMGAGIALEFSLRYPEMLFDYEEKCKNRLITVGKVDYYKTQGITIINFPTKWHFKYPSKIEWIEQGLIDFVNTYKAAGITSVAFPRLGTSNGGLDWPDVQRVMEKYLSDLDIEVLICLDNGPAEGLEKEMVDRFNDTDFSKKIPDVKLNAKQIASLEEAKPIDRFWKVKELDGIGITCYKKLHEYFRKEKQNTFEQMAFDI